MYDSTTKYNGLVKAIAKQLGIDTTIKELEIKYLVSDRCPPISIHNDTSVQVYLDQKKYNMDFFSKFPLCITCIDRAMDAFDFRTDAQSSYQSNNMEIYLFCTSDAIHLSDIRPTVEDDVLKFSGVEIISNPQNESVEESQVYIDKHTLSEVMKRYSFLRQFRFIAARSCHKRPIMVIDGTHLRSTYEGTMLTSTTSDAGGPLCIVLNPGLDETQIGPKPNNMFQEPAFLPVLSPVYELAKLPLFCFWVSLEPVCL
ncbi:hypothetical protein FXO38_30614 [Capsicum annuum]|nr:hypothetical protein FXO38_30614 [Capsicum annuum]KAF3630719.1 hypothetical protein FXO37_28333 [Capsicum annuum]